MLKIRRDPVKKESGNKRDKRVEFDELDGEIGQSWIFFSHCQFFKSILEENKDQEHKTPRMNQDLWDFSPIFDKLLIMIRKSIQEE